MSAVPAEPRGTLPASPLNLTCLALATGLVLTFIRTDAIGYPLYSVFVPVDLFVILECAYFDLRTIGAGLLGALLLRWIVCPRVRALRILSLGFTAWTLLVLMFGVVNHQALGMLGAPVNYRWIYYADNLMSYDAKQSISAGLGMGQIAMIVGSVLGAFFGAALLRRLCLGLSRGGPKRGRRLAIVAGGVATFYFAFMTWWMWGSAAWARHDNPVVALVRSYLVEEQASIFTMATHVGVADLLPVDERPPAPKLSFERSDIRNVLIFVLESTPAVYVDTYGSEYGATPTLQRLSSQSLTCEAAYTPAPTTNKAMVSMLCGVYPWVSHAALTKDHADNRLTGLSDVLKARGYRTGFFNSADLRHQGGDQFLAHLSYDVIEDLRNRDTDRPGFQDPRWSSMDSSDDLATTESFLQWIRRAPDEPFFGVVWTFGMHYPYFFRGEQHPFYKGRRRWLNKYLNALHYADSCLDRILTTLDDLGTRKDTLIVVVGDHGEAFGQHGQWAHASRIYEENVRVPLIFINEGLFSGTRHDPISSLIDIAPTVLDVLGLPHPDSWQGRSILRPMNRERVYFFSPWSHLLFGYREGSRKSIYNAKVERFRVYDLATDPLEKRNLVDSLPGAKSDILPKLAAWVQFQARFMRERVVLESKGR